MKKCKHFLEIIKVRELPELHFSLEIPIENLKLYMLSLFLSIGVNVLKAKESSYKFCIPRMSFLEALEPSFWNMNSKEDGILSSCFTTQWKLKPRHLAPLCNFLIVIKIEVYIFLLIKTINMCVMDYICQAV